MTPNKQRVIVTGGAGKLGRACVEDLLANGYDVLVIDRVPPATPKCAFIAADLADFGQALDAISTRSQDEPTVAPYAVVHLAAIPAPRLKPDAETFRNNTLSDYNVFEACRRLGVQRVVYASSETVLGLPFDEPPPYVPIDENAPPRPNSAYSLAKLLSETMAEQFCRWQPGVKMIGLRFSNVMEPGDYAMFESWQADATKRKWNLWGYIDARDGSQAIRLAIESPMTGSHVYIIANADTVMRRANAELMNETFPGIEQRPTADATSTLLSVEKAKRELGYEPQCAWRKLT